MADKAGSIELLCEMIGVSRISFFKWSRQNGQMTGASKTAVRAVAEKLGVKPPNLDKQGEPQES